MVIPTWLMRLATGRVVLFALAVWIAYSVLFFALGPYTALHGATGGPLLEETFGYGALEVQEWLQTLKEPGRKDYGTFQLLDALNAVLMAVALTLSLAFTLSRLVGKESLLGMLAYLPIAAGMGELIENFMLLAALSSYPEALPAAGLIGTVTSIKLLVGFSALLVTLLCFAWVGINALRGRRRRPVVKRKD